MKQNKLPLILLTLCTFFIFKNNLLIQNGILTSCQLFITKLFPSLFPMMILTDLFLYFDLRYLFEKKLGYFFQKFLHISANGLFIFLISLFSGTPTNVYALKNLYLEEKITKKEAEHLLKFIFFSNPLFLYTMLTLIFPNDLKTTFILLFLPYFVNILIAIFSIIKVEQTENMIFNFSKESLGSYLSKSINKAMSTLLLILGCVCLFCLLDSFINPWHFPLLTGTLEISSGLKNLISSSISFEIKKILAYFFISFGGLSIHLQVKGILSDTDISYLSFFFFFLLEFVIGFIILISLCNIC